MGWDPSVLRKYNTTGHFRLLNQLRSELQANPMVRLAVSPDVPTQAGRGRRSQRPVEVRPLAYGRGRRASGSAGSPAAQPSAPCRPGPPSPDSSQGSEVAGATFRERLNAIEMR